MLVLRAEDVRAVLGMPAAIDAMRPAFAQLAAGEATMPERSAIQLAAEPAPMGTTVFMPAYLRRSGQLGVKVVSVIPSNRARGLPAVPATMLLLDAETGLPLALLDGTYLTALRTGAAAGLAADLLARPDARVLTLFGAGGQAPAQIEAMCCVRTIERLWLVNRTPAHAERLASQLAAEAWFPREVRVAQAGDAQTAVAEADIIATATAASGAALFPGEWVRPGTHVSASGAVTPQTRELDSALLARALIVVDHRPAALSEAGDLLMAKAEGAIGPDAIHADLGELVLGTRPGRASPEQITCFKSVGVAVQDVAAADAAYREARRFGVGVEVAM